MAFIEYSYVDIVKSHFLEKKKDLQLGLIFFPGKYPFVKKTKFSKGCPFLSSMAIPKTVIEDYVFLGCPALKKKKRTFHVHKNMGVKSCFKDCRAKDFFHMDLWLFISIIKTKT